jgi:8-hydroxy-5-deazaflavin:NADPH oxidoreductase
MSGSRRSARPRRQFLVTAGVTVAGLALIVLPLAAQATTYRTAHPLKIGIIGAGTEGSALGRLWAKAGHQIMFASRHPEELKDLVASVGPNSRAGAVREAAAFGEVVVLAMPYGAVPEIGRDYASEMKGKVVIDVGNPREDRDGPMANDALKKGTGIASAEYLPGVRLVRAFNALGASQVTRGAFREGERVGVPIAGDDAAAVATVSQLAEDAGLEPVVVGGLARAREFDRDTPVYVKGMSAREIREILKLPPKR